MTGYEDDLDEPERVAGWAHLASALGAIAAGGVLVAAALNGSQLIDGDLWIGLIGGLATLGARWLLADEHPMRDIVRAQETTTPIILPRERLLDVLRSAGASFGGLLGAATALAVVWAAASAPVLVVGVIAGLGRAIEWLWVRRYEARFEVVAIRTAPDGDADDDDDPRRQTVLLRSNPVMAAFGR